MDALMAWLREEFLQAAAGPRYLQLANTIESAIKRRILSMGDFLPDPLQLEYSLYEFWQSQGIVPDRQHFCLKVLTSSSENASLLNIDTGVPLVRVRQMSHNAQGEILEFSEVLCRSDVYEFEFSC